MKPLLSYVPLHLALSGRRVVISMGVDGLIPPSPHYVSH